MATRAESEWVSSQEELAKRLGCHSRSFPRWRRNFTDAPKPRQNGDHSVREWCEFFATHPEIQLDIAQDHSLLLDNAIKEKKDRLLAIKVAEAEHSVIPLADVEAWLADKIDQQRQILRTGLRGLMPKIRGLEIPKMIEKGDEFLDQVQQPICSLADQLAKLRSQQSTSPAADVEA